MLTLAELCERAATGNVRLRGVERAVRPLTALEAQRIRRAYPRPVEPGGNAQAAAYQAAVTEWGAKMQIVEAGIGLGYQTKAGLSAEQAWGDEGKVYAWCEAAWQELGGLLSESEVRLVLDAMRAAAVGAVEEASKNS